MQERLAELRREKALLAEENARLSAEVAAVMDAPDADDKERLDPREAERRYADALSAILDAKRKAAQQKERSDRVAFELQARLDEKEFKAKKIADSFKAFKREIFLAAEHSRTGKKLSKKVIDEFEAQEALRDQELEKVRLKNINLRNALKKCEAKLRAKEQLAEGLHLIDFEQLKIENQALAEKIEDRKDEIEKLRKKHAANVRVATHARETLAFEEKLCEKDAGNSRRSTRSSRWSGTGSPSSRRGERRNECARHPGRSPRASPRTTCSCWITKSARSRSRRRRPGSRSLGARALLEADVAKNNALLLRARWGSRGPSLALVANLASVPIVLNSRLSRKNVTRQTITHASYRAWSEPMKSPVGMGAGPLGISTVTFTIGVSLLGSQAA